MIFFKAIPYLRESSRELASYGEFFFLSFYYFYRDTKNQRQEGEMFILIKRCNLFCKQKTSNPNQRKHCLMLSDATLTALCTIYPKIYLTVNEPFWNIDNIVTSSLLLI